MSTTPSFPVVFGTEYSFYSSLGLYLSYHTASHYAVLNSSAEGIWFAANGSGQTGQPVSTGAVLFVGVKILFDHWLYWPGSGDVYFTSDPNTSFQVQLFTDPNSRTSGEPINVGDAVYFFFPAFGVYLSQDTTNTEYLTAAASSSALAWTIGTM